MNKSILFLAFAFLLFSCKSKKKNKEKGEFFSVVQFLGGQVKQMDSASYHYTRITTIDSTSDTTAIPPSSFRQEAQDFLSLPDISKGSKKDDYDVDNTYDDLLKNALLTYTANNDDAEVRRETIMLGVDSLGNSDVRTIIVNTIKQDGDSTVEKDLTWHVGKRFQVVTKTSRTSQPEKIRTKMVKWE